MSTYTPIRRLKAGTRVRVLTGAAAGKLGVIASQQASIATHYKIKFEPPVYLPAVGHVASVERAVTDLVSI